MYDEANHLKTLQAVARTGDILAQDGEADPIRIVIAGGVAGLLVGLSRATLDCDVLSCSDEQWERVEKAARRIAPEFDFPATWLNRECSIYTNDFPLGWDQRVELVDRFGQLEVYRVSRKDWIGAKLVSSPKRPQDTDDIQQLNPTAEELHFAEENLDRLTAEHLDGYDYAPQRAILESIRSKL
jgi:hypothetical protein